MIENPVILKEIRTRLRLRYPVAVKVAICLIVGGVVAMAYNFALQAIFTDPSRETFQTAWQAAFMLQSVLIWLVCPAIAANAITQEREQQTWESITYSLLTPGQILSAKLLIRLVPIGILISLFLPFSAVCTAMGGAKFGDFVLATVVTLVWMVFMTSVSLYCSWAFRKTAAAIVMSYVSLFALSIGTLLVESTLSLGGSRMDSPIVWLNPIRVASAVVDSHDYQAGRVITVSSLFFIAVTVLMFVRMSRHFYDTDDVG